MNLRFILSAIVILLLSGLPALLASRAALWGQRAATALMVLGSALGFYGVVMTLAHGVAQPAPHVLWDLPLGQFDVALDTLSAIFLAPIFLIPALGSIYGLGYWKQSEHQDNGRKLTLFYGLLAGSMALVVIARNSVLLVMAWEVMAVSAFFLAATEDDDPAVRRAGWVYLIATHLGTMCLLALFALLHQVTGSYALTPLAPSAATPGVMSAIFLLAVIGFGFKAGLMPLHVWLPGAHANAPSHVSAVMSGVMLKMGIYGIVRITSLLPVVPTWWAGLVLSVGAVTGVLGIAFAIGQHDLKRLLAYSSIENIGIIALGLGLALLGRALGRTDWIVLGLAGALLHVWNHSLFKSLLFLNSGAIIHAVHTRDMDRLGGLSKRMPLTAVLFVVGAVAICALPPLNGFVSEWMIYLGLFLTVGGDSSARVTWPVAGLGVAVLAVIGALAVACFVKLLGAVFLGESRSAATAHAHDPGWSLKGPMWALAGGCVAVATLSWVAAVPLNRAAAEWSGIASSDLPVLQSLAPLRRLGMIAAILLAALMVGGILVAAALRRRGRAAAGNPTSPGTWDCGFAFPTARMQYTGSSFGDSIVGLFTWALWPRTKNPDLGGTFAFPTSFKSIVPDTVLDRFVLPVFRRAQHYLPWLRLLQQGRIQIYVLYILAMVLILLLWSKIGS